MTRTAIFSALALLLLTAASHAGGTPETGDTKAATKTAGSGQIFTDGFESGDVSRWSTGRGN